MSWSPLFSAFEKQNKKCMYIFFLQLQKVTIVRITAAFFSVFFFFFFCSYLFPLLFLSQTVKKNHKVILQVAIIYKAYHLKSKLIIKTEENAFDFMFYFSCIHERKFHSLHHKVCLKQGVEITFSFKS